MKGLKKKGKKAGKKRREGDERKVGRKKAIDNFNMKKAYPFYDKASGATLPSNNLSPPPKKSQCYI